MRFSLYIWPVKTACSMLVIVQRDSCVCFRSTLNKNLTQNRFKIHNHLIFLKKVGKKRVLAFFPTQNVVVSVVYMFVFQKLLYAKCSFKGSFKLANSHGINPRIHCRACKGQ